MIDSMNMYRVLVIFYSRRRELPPFTVTCEDARGGVAPRFALHGMGDVAGSFMISRRVDSASTA